MINVALIGAGRVGAIRADRIRLSKRSQLVGVSDEETSRAAKLGSVITIEQILQREDIVAVVVSVPTKSHAEITNAALRVGKHVLCEKPLGMNSIEALNTIRIAEKAGKILHVGFDYRHMAHIKLAKDFIEKGAIGNPIFFRCRYGHGGRVGYEKEWCTQKKMGGGALIEQGIHILDLVRHLFGEPSQVMCRTDCCFHKLKDTEDNAFLLLDTNKGLAQIHISWTQWKNLFEVEIFGTDGYIRLEGRGGYYGKQRLIYGIREKDHGIPSESVHEFDNSQDSWMGDWMEFEREILDGEKTDNAVNALQAQILVDAAYESEKTKSWVKVR